MTRTNKKVRYSPQSKQLPLAQTSGPGKTCAPEAAEEMFRILEGRWKMAILFHLFGGIDKKCRVMRFSELERAIPAISQKMLIQQLRELERDGNCVAHNLSPDSAQGGIPADQGWNSTPSRLACAPCMGSTSERSNAPVFIATPHLKCSTFLRVSYLFPHHWWGARDSAL